MVQNLLILEFEIIYSHVPTFRNFRTEKKKIFFSMIVLAIFAILYILKNTILSRIT